MTTVFQQYRNENRHRRYPFADSATLTSDDGRRLPADFMIDAMLYVIDATGPLYMSELDLESCIAYFTDAATRKVCAWTQWISGAGSATVYDVSGFEREAGIIVFGGAGAPEVSAGSVLKFAAAATPFCPACCVPLRQTGVRGLRSESDGLLATGHVLLLGQGGVQILTYVDAEGRSVARLNIVGAPPAPATDCDGSVLIRSIRVVVEECSPVVAGSAGPGILTLSGAPGFSLDNRCAKQRLPDADGKLPGAFDVCEDAHDDPAPYACPPTAVVTPGLADGKLFITAPSSLDGGNPVGIETELVPGPPMTLPQRKAADPQEAIAGTRQAMRTAQPAGRVTISLRGGGK